MLFIVEGEESAGLLCGGTGGGRIVDCLYEEDVGGLEFFLKVRMFLTNWGLWIRLVNEKWGYRCNGLSKNV